MDKHHLDIAITAARAGARELMRFRDDFSVREKAPKDLVTDADLASQSAIFEIIREAFPSEILVGEENGFDTKPVSVDNQSPSNPIWIVDPLDGTLNYVHQLQNFCVSIGLVNTKGIQLGVILDPVCDELFIATRGGGAWVSSVDGQNAKRLSVSKCQNIDQALFACSFPAGVKADSIEIREFCQVIEQSQSVRRLGSCALNMCYVAAGRLDGYWARSVKVWDMVAGALMITEAGGVINDLNGKELDIWYPQFAAAATGQLQKELLSALSSYQP